MNGVKGDDSLANMPTIIPSFYVIEITDETFRYLHTLCERFHLTEEELIFHSLNLAERDYAEFSAHMSEQYPEVWYED